MDEMSDPMGSLASAAISHNEIYRAWVDAGFTEEQAFELVKAIVVTLIQGAIEC